MEVQVFGSRVKVRVQVKPSSSSEKVRVKLKSFQLGQQVQLLFLLWFSRFNQYPTFFYNSKHSWTYKATLWRKFSKISSKC